VGDTATRIGITIKKVETGPTQKGRPNRATSSAIGVDRVERRVGMRFLLCTDGSQYSNIALKAAHHLLKPGDSLTILHVMDKEENLEEGEKILEEAKKVLETVGNNISVDTKLLFGDPAHTIVGEAGMDYDLLIMGSHGLKGLTQLLFGDVAVKVATHVEIPTLIVKHTDRLDRVLLCLGESKATEENLRIAKKILGHIQPETTVVYHTEETPPPKLRDYLDYLTPDRVDMEEKLREIHHHTVETHLQRAKNILGEIGGEVQTRIVEGEPTTKITEEIKSGKYNLIVVGTHGILGWKRYLIGKLVWKILKTADISILLLRPKRKGLEKPRTVQKPVHIPIAA